MVADEVEVVIVEVTVAEVPGQMVIRVHAPGSVTVVSDELVARPIEVHSETVPELRAADRAAYLMAAARRRVATVEEDGSPSYFPRTYAPSRALAPMTGGFYFSAFPHEALDTVPGLAPTKRIVRDATDPLPTRSHQ